MFITLWIECRNTPRKTDWVDLIERIQSAQYMQRGTVIPHDPLHRYSATQLFAFFVFRQLAVERQPLIGFISSAWSTFHITVPYSSNFKYCKRQQSPWHNGRKATAEKRRL